MRRRSCSASAFWGVVSANCWSLVARARRVPARNESASLADGIRRGIPFRATIVGELASALAPADRARSSLPSHLQRSVVPGAFVEQVGAKSTWPHSPAALATGPPSTTVSESGRSVAASA